jgi:hypothetical protein
MNEEITRHGFCVEYIHLGNTLDFSKMHNKGCMGMSSTDFLMSFPKIQMDLSGHPPLPLNHHFEPVVLINHDIHPFDGEWNVMSSSFVNYSII